jgi:hypothetical protein
MIMTKKIKEKTVEQLHDEIMALFIGQEMSTTLNALIQTTVGVADFLEVANADLMCLIVNEMQVYNEMKEEQ